MRLKQKKEFVEMATRNYRDLLFWTLTDGYNEAKKFKKEHDDLLVKHFPFSLWEFLLRVFFSRKHADYLQRLTHNAQ